MSNPPTPPYTEATVELLARTLHVRYCMYCTDETWTDCIGYGSKWQRTSARDILDALVKAGLLLPEGAETQYAAGVAAGRAQAAADLEQPGSILCDCTYADSLPTNSRSGARMEHHCDCRAVEAAAVLLGAYTATRHAAECGHGPEFDEGYAKNAGAAVGGGVAVQSKDPDHA